MADRKRSVAVIGLGAFGRTVATELAGFDMFVLGIDLDPRRVSAVADTLAEAKILDATDDDALREAGLARFDAVVIAIGEDVEASILATMNARLIGCRTIWAKAKDRTHHRILVKLGADRVILPEQEIAREVALMLHNPAIHDFMTLGNAFFAISVDVPETLAGRSLGALDLPGQRLRAIGLMRGQDFLEPAADQVLAARDRLLLLGGRAELRAFSDGL